LDAQCTQASKDMVRVADYCLKREESACAAISLKEGASSGRNPPRLARRMKLFRQDIKLAKM